MKTVVFSSTQFGLRCIREGILPVREAELTGILTTPGQVEFAKSGRPLDVSTHADFSSAARSARCPLVQLDGPPDKHIYLKHLKDWQAELLLVLGWYYLIPPAVLDSLPLGALGIHASLLPRYRGMAPISWAIINGETETGVSLFYLEKGVDTGDIVAQRKITVSGIDTCATVYDRATEVSIDLLREYLPKLADGTAPRTPQDHDRMTQYPRRTPEDGLIDWSWSAKKIYDFIRAQTRPYPGAFTLFNGRKLTIWSAARLTAVPGVAPAIGETMTIDNQVAVMTGEGMLMLLDCQFDGEDNTIDPVKVISTGSRLG